MRLYLRFAAVLATLALAAAGIAMSGAAQSQTASLAARLMFATTPTR